MAVVNEQIAASSDDCAESNAGVSLNAEGLTIGRIYMTTPPTDETIDIGLRWQTVSVPQSATISAAKLSLYLVSEIGTLEAEIKGVDEDDASTWADSAGNKPSDKTKTTAVVSADESDWNNWGTSQWIDIEIKTIVQEIVNRSGWSSGNDLAVVIENTCTTDVTNMINVYAYDHTGNAHGAKLDITYSTSGGISIPVVMYYRRMMEEQ